MKLFTQIQVALTLRTGHRVTRPATVVASAGDRVRLSDGSTWRPARFPADLKPKIWDLRLLDAAGTELAMRME